MKPNEAQITIRLFAMFKEIAQKKEIQHSIQAETTLSHVLEMLAHRYGKDFNDTINKDTEQVDVNTLIMINGQTIRDTNVKLKDNDLLIITVPAAGG